MKPVELYVGDDRIRHDPDLAAGEDGFIAYVVRMAEEDPHKTIAFVWVVVEETWWPFTPTRRGRGTSRT